MYPGLLKRRPSWLHILRRFALYPSPLFSITRLPENLKLVIVETTCTLLLWAIHMHTALHSISCTCELPAMLIPHGVGRW